MLKRKFLALGILLYGVSSRVFAECTGDMPCIESGKGIIEGNEKADQAITTINWGFGAVALGVGVWLAINAAVKFKDQQYGQGMASAGGVLVMMIIFAVVKTKLI